MVGMVLLAGVALAMISLLVVVMIAMTRHLLAHPDDTLRGQGSGSWSDGLAGSDAPTARTPAADAVAAAHPRPAPRPHGMVPLDDMPAEAIAEAARRIARHRD